MVYLKEMMLLPQAQKRASQAHLWVQVVCWFSNWDETG